MNIFDRTGKVALGSRLRALSQTMTDDATKIYELYGADFSPKWFPVFFVLYTDGKKAITEIATEIGHSQPSVTKIVKEMAKAGLIENSADLSDRRRNVVGLTDKGNNLSKQMQHQLRDIEDAVDQILDETSYNLWEALNEWEFLLGQKSLLQRVKEIKKQRESKQVKIVEFDSKYKTAFKELNQEWISEYFEMEESDYKTLDNPEAIINNGGKIFVALYSDEPLGVCALLKLDDPDYDFELVKMAVSPRAQGKSIGYLLGKAVLDSAKELGAKKVFLESNTSLTPAINLYYKLGFKKISGRPSPYKRANIQMEKILD